MQGALGQSPSGRMVSPLNCPMCIISCTPPASVSPKDACPLRLAGAANWFAGTGAQGRSFLAFMGVLATASLLASIRVTQQSDNARVLLASQPPSVAPVALDRSAVVRWPACK